MAVTGIAASGGKALATVFVYVPPEMAAEEERAEDLTAEQVMARVNAAIEWVDQAMARKIEHAKGQGREILEMQRVMLNDSMLLSGIEEAVQEGKSAAAAVAVSTKKLITMLESLNDPLFTMRIPDTRDVGLRLTCRLTGQNYPDLAQVEGQVILTGEDLPPSLLAGADSEKIAGVVMGSGNKTCHAAILCSALGIPALMGAAGWQQLPGGQLAYLDGDAGQAELVPGERRAEFECRLAEWKQEQTALEAYRDRPTVTAEGHVVGLYCNIFSTDTAKKAQELGADGAGLFRTEFLYTGRPDLPGEEEQFAVYKAALEAMPGKAITFRTMDIGGDKPVEALGLEQEQNAFLGYRAIRICLDRPELFLTQLRALLRASAFGKVQIMFPMIATLEELRRAKKYVAQAKEQLAQKGQAFDPNAPVGMMVEVPAAAVLARQFAREADFFSIGSNDLTQYTMAADRMNPKVEHLSNPMGPAVLTLIAQTIQAAKQAGIPCSVCGELAGMVEAVPVLLGLGLEKFSVSPGKLLAVRRAIAGCSEEEAQRAARRALS